MLMQRELQSRARLKCGPEHNVAYERSFMKAPENENRKGGRERGKIEGVSLTI